MKSAASGYPPTRKDTDITAGVPGLGLSGLFVLLSALALPLTRRRRVPVARLFGLAVVMTAAIILTWAAIAEAASHLHTTTTGHPHPATGLAGLTAGIAIHAGRGAWRVPLIAISASIMVLVIATGAALLRLVGIKPTPTPPPIEAALSPGTLRVGTHRRHDHGARR